VLIVLAQQQTLPDQGNSNVDPWTTFVQTPLIARAYWSKRIVRDAPPMPIFEY
jgi:hypothetical protein